MADESGRRPCGFGLPQDAAATKKPAPGNGTGFHINCKQNESLGEGYHYNLLPAAQDESEATEAEERGAGRLWNRDWSHLEVG